MSWQPISERPMDEDVICCDVLCGEEFDGLAFSTRRIVCNDRFSSEWWDWVEPPSHPYKRLFFMPMPPDPPLQQGE